MILPWKVSVPVVVDVPGEMVPATLVKNGVRMVPAPLRPPVIMKKSPGVRSRPSTFIVPANWLTSIRLVSEPAEVMLSAAAPRRVKRSTVTTVSSVVVPAADRVTSK